MSSPNVELVRSLFDAWGRGDYSATEWAHPEIEFAVVDGPSPGFWTGLEGMVAGYREVMNAWRDYRGSAERCLELDQERVLVLIDLSGRGRTSGLELEHGAAGLFHVRDGRVTRLALYFDRQRALADLGLAR
jgi:ketosteroid isomerase-like protein